MFDHFKGRKEGAGSFQSTRSKEELVITTKPRDSKEIIIACKEIMKGKVVSIDISRFSDQDKEKHLRFIAGVVFGIQGE